MGTQDNGGLFHATRKGHTKPAPRWGMGRDIFGKLALTPSPRQSAKAHDLLGDDSKPTNERESMKLTLKNVHGYILTGIANGNLNWDEPLTGEGLQNLLTLNWDAVNPTEERESK